MATSDTLAWAPARTGPSEEDRTCRATEKGQKKQLEMSLRMTNDVCLAVWQVRHAREIHCWNKTGVLLPPYFLTAVSPRPSVSPLLPPATWWASQCVPLAPRHPQTPLFPCLLNEGAPDRDVQNSRGYGDGRASRPPELGPS